MGVNEKTRVHRQTTSGGGRKGTKEKAEAEGRDAEKERGRDIHTYVHLRRGEGRLSESEPSDTAFLYTGGQVLFFFSLLRHTKSK